MKKFNINDYMYIQITKEGWKHLKETVGNDYIKHCINAPSYKMEIDGEIWYRLQCHNAFDILPIKSRPLFKTNVMFDGELLTK